LSYVKNCLEKAAPRRDSLFEEVATLTIESTALEDGVNQIIKALEAQML